MKIYNLEMVSSQDIVRPNFLLNGYFNFWQRNTTFNSSNFGFDGVTGFYTADRWFYYQSFIEPNPNVSYATIERSSDIPPDYNYESQYSIKITSTTVSGGTDPALYYIGQKIEGHNSTTLIGKKCTLSFFVKSSNPGKYFVALKNYANDLCYITPYEIEEENTWEYKTITLQMTDSGAWKRDREVGLRIYFILRCGGDGRIPADSINTWYSGNYYSAHMTQGDLFGSSGRNIYFANIKFEPGIGPTIGMGRTIDQELAACQRYFEKSYSPEITIGTITDVGAKICRIPSTTEIEGDYAFVVTKRVIPTLYSFSPNTERLWSRIPGSIYCRNLNTGVDVNITYPIVGGSTGYIARGGFSRLLLASAQTTGNKISFHWVADSELYT
jgi:hypothetical protein